MKRKYSSRSKKLTVNQVNLSVCVFKSVRLIAKVGILSAMLFVFPSVTWASSLYDYDDYKSICCGNEEQGCFAQCCNSSKYFADKGDKYALYKLAECYLLGAFGDRNVASAMQAYVKSAKLGYGPAFTALSEWVAHGHSPTEPCEHTRALLQLAISHNDPKAKVELAYHDLLTDSSLTGDAIKKNIDVITSAATEGSARAITMLGKMRLRGTHCKKNYEEALNLLKIAADQKEVYAIIALGIINEFGSYGVDANIEEAEKWYRKACEYTSYRDLYVLHKLGRFLALRFDQKDLGKVEFGMKLLIYAADQNDIESQKTLIDYFDVGIGVVKNPEQRDYWKQRLAQNQQKSDGAQAKIAQAIDLDLQ